MIFNIYIYIFISLGFGLFSVWSETVLTDLVGKIKHMWFTYHIQEYITSALSDKILSLSAALWKKMTIYMYQYDES